MLSTEILEILIWRKVENMVGIIQKDEQGRKDKREYSWTLIYCSSDHL